MQTVLIVIHLMVVVALVAVVLLQRSEGGALGVGGGSGFMTGRGQANVLTRATAILATIFFVTSLGLTLIARYGHGSGKLNFDAVAPAGPSETAPANLPAKGQGSVLDQLRELEQQRSGGAPAAGGQPPAGQATSATPGATPAPTATPSTLPATTPAPAAPATASPSKPTAAEPSGMPERPAPSVETPAAPAQK